jgi:hypothetical protein
MKPLSNVVVGVCWAITMSGLAICADRLTQIDGLQYLKAAGEVVSSCDVSYEVRISWNLKSSYDESTGKTKFRQHLPGEVSPPRTYRYRFIFDRGKYRYELIDPSSGKMDGICVIVKSEWRYKEFVGRSGPSFTVRQRTSPPGGGWKDYREFLGTHFSDYPLHQLLSVRNSLNVSRDEMGRVILETVPEPDREISGRLNGYRVVLNPKHGLMVEELIENYGGIPKRKSEVVDWHEYAKGQPTYKELAGEVYCVYDLDVDVSRSSWNRPVDPSLFELHADSGMPVVDSVKGIMTMGGKANPGDNIDELANQPIKFQTGPPAEVVKKSWPWTTIGLVSAVLTLVAAGLWWRYRWAM